MNWEIPELSTRSILSFSDAHSPAKMGREATIMELERADYPSIRAAIMRPSQSVIAREAEQSHKKKIATSPLAPRNDNKIVYTIEFYPEEGKYHFTGHRDCKVSRNPEEVGKLGIICPVCHKRMTEGVLYRVQQLAGESYAPQSLVKMSEHNLKWYVDKKKIHPPFVKLVPLLEVIAESMESTVVSQKVKEQYKAMVSSLGNEMDVLLKVPVEDIKMRFGAKLADGIVKVRRGDIVIIPGFDNQYGVVKIRQDAEEAPTDTEQMSLL
jgi:PHP family Zn ribbon phosphoesterase